MQPTEALRHTGSKCAVPRCAPGRAALSPAAVDASPPPRGTLESWPLPQLFIHVVDHRLSGSLALHSGAREVDVIVFSDGAPMRARTARLVAPLGEMLVRYGVLADVDLASALARASSAKAMLGQQLIADKIIDRRVLLRALRDQLLLRLRGMARLPSTTEYEFHSNNDLLEEDAPTGATSCDPLAALLTVLRAWPERASVDALLAPLAQQTVRLHEAATIDRFELEESEKRFLERALEAKLTYASALRSTLAPEASIRALLYALVVSHHLDDGSGAFPLDVDPPEVGGLRSSSLDVGMTKERTDEVMRVVSAADHHREAQVLLAAGKLAAAEQLAARAAALDGTEPEYRALLGHLVARRGARDEGLALLDRAIAEAPRSDRALVYRAKIYEREGASEEALRDYGAAEALNPTNPDASRAMRVALGKSGRWTTDAGVPRPLAPPRTPPPPAAKPTPSPLPPIVMPSGALATPPASAPDARRGWWLIGALVVATLAMLAFYVLRLR